MGKFIEEFYYRDLDPQARSTKENKTVQKQMEVLMLNEDFLTWGQGWGQGDGSLVSFKFRYYSLRFSAIAQSTD